MLCGECPIFACFFHCIFYFLVFLLCHSRGVLWWQSLGDEQIKTKL